MREKKDADSRSGRQIKKKHVALLRVFYPVFLFFFASSSPLESRRRRAGRKKKRRAKREPAARKTWANTRDPFSETDSQRHNWRRKKTQMRPMAKRGSAIPAAQIARAAAFFPPLCRDRIYLGSVLVSFHSIFASRCKTACSATTRARVHPVTRFFSLFSLCGGFPPAPFVGVCVFVFFQY